MPCGLPAWSRVQVNPVIPIEPKSPARRYSSSFCPDAFSTIPTSRLTALLLYANSAPGWPVISAARASLTKSGEG